MSDTFTQALWASIGDIYEAILRHPFVTGLTDASLPAEAFSFYVVQDVLFLRRYAQALAAAASRAPHTAETEMFARHSAGIVAVEMSLHDSLLADLGIDPAELDTAQEAPATLAYTSYLMATTLGASYADGIGALLPCYWIYWEVGKHLLERGSPDPRYQKWIDTYSGDEFGAEVRDVLAVTNRLGDELTPAGRDSVRDHFRATSRYEWMFWDMAYRQESWPV
jgi:thiaminase (transcriptional activator TenA)